MPKRKAPSSRVSTRRNTRARRSLFRPRRRLSRARPMRSLKTDYRSINVYRYMRETIPTTASFSVIPQGAGSGIPAIAYMSFENLQFQQMPGATDFTNLYARYKVDKIVTTLVPMVEEITNVVGGASQLEITRVNTKWMNSDFPIASNSEDQLKELAQLQSKTKTLYARSKPLTLVTVNPGVNARTVVDSSGNEVDARTRSPWLALSGPNAAIDVPFKHNALIFAARVDGVSMDTGWKYRVTHKLYFRCSQVG